MSRQGEAQRNQPAQAALASAFRVPSPSPSLWQWSWQPGLTNANAIFSATPPRGTCEDNPDHMGLVVPGRCR